MEDLRVVHVLKRFSSARDLAAYAQANMMWQMQKVRLDEKGARYSYTNVFDHGKKYRGKYLIEDGTHMIAADFDCMVLIDPEIVPLTPESIAAACSFNPTDVLHVVVKPSKK